MGVSLAIMKLQVTEANTHFSALHSNAVKHTSRERARCSGLHTARPAPKKAVPCSSFLEAKSLVKRDPGLSSEADKAQRLEPFTRDVIEQFRA